MHRKSPVRPRPRVSGAVRFALAVVVAAGCGESVLAPGQSAPGQPSLAPGSGRTIQTILDLAFANAALNSPPPATPIAPDIGGPVTVFPEGGHEGNNFVWVRSDVPPLTDKAVVLNRTNTYEGVVLMNASVAGTPPSAGQWLFRTMIAPLAAAGGGKLEIHGGVDGGFVIESLAFSVDAESGNRLIYLHDGPVTAWSVNQVFDVAIAVDLDRQRTTTWINGVVVRRNSPFGHSDANTLHSVVVSMWDAGHTTSVAWDNISIVGSVPPGRL